MITGFREFSEEDWFGFSGAEEFSKDSPPLIGTIEIDPINSGLIIFCKGAVDIYLDHGGFNSHEEQSELWQLDADWLQTKEQAERFADFVNMVEDEYDLRMLGFVSQGGIR